MNEVGTELFLTFPAPNNHAYEEGRYYITIKISLPWRF
jgi:hypothetical protein